MSEGKRPVGRPKGSKASEKQKAAARENFKKGPEVRRKRAEERRAQLEKPRWKQLEDGDISVRDLTYKELVRRQCANNDGSWEGKRHALPPRLVSRMEAEFVRRARQGVDNLTKPAMRALRIRLEDDDNPAQQFAAARMILEYRIGKVPDVVHIGAETEYDRMNQTAFVILRGDENVTVDEEEGDIVEGEWREG